MIVENHPLEPFLPQNAKILFLGSFPPPKKRWCMDFYYPNFTNDHWRIEGSVWYGDRNYFVDQEKKCFLKEKIVCFLNEKGIALYDTAQVVRRLKDNASDAFLEIVEPTDLRTLLNQLPECHAIATTGEKATGEVCRYFGLEKVPALGSKTELEPGLFLYRLPSSSRAYPLSFDKKVEAYRVVFDEVFSQVDIEKVRQWAVNRWTLGKIHGISHWERVERNGLLLATPECDLTVIRLFAYLHDSCRQTDCPDVEHGLRAAEMMVGLRDSLLKGLSDGQFALLQQACRLHTTTHRTGNPTVDACFDADRLDLGRVGIQPDPEKMATEKGRAMAAEALGKGRHQEGQ